MTYFNAARLPNAGNEYVLWVDCMGTKISMSKSIDISANFIGKFHNAVTLHSMDVPGLRAYPVMDGAYVTSDNLETILAFISKLFKSITKCFTKERKIRHRFMIRGALSFGLVQHGANMPIEVFCPSNTAQDRKEYIQNYKESLLMGLPVIQAFTSERSAPPFGVFIHESVRAYNCGNSRPLPVVWYNWFGNRSIVYSEEDKKKLVERVNEYYEYYENLTYETGYSKDKIDQHKKMFEQFIKVCEPDSLALPRIEAV